MTGGKFANGAVYGAWSRAFNDEEHLEEQAHNNAIFNIAERVDSNPKGITDISENELFALLSFYATDTRAKKLHEITNDAYLIEELKIRADNSLFFGKLQGAKFRIKSINNNVYSGSDINYVVIGMHFASLNGTGAFGLNSIIFNPKSLDKAIFMHNKDQINQGIDPIHNMRQATESGPLFGKIGYEFYKNKYK
jgi:hypothetical protein